MGRVCRWACGRATTASASPTLGGGWPRSTADRRRWRSGGPVETAARWSRRRFRMRSNVKRVLIADDEPLARDRIRMLLANHDDCEVVGEAHDGTSAVDAILE